MNPVPLTILTGFLGAGKTTLLNHILHAPHGLRIAVLVNDFGAINIDSQLVVGVQGETVSLSNGCICCTIREDLLTETLKLMRLPMPPEYIIVETSGVSDPYAVAMTFRLPELQPYIRLDGILTVVDADQLQELTEENTELAMQQIEAADIVILNKADLVDEPYLISVQALIQRMIPHARILNASYGKVPLELVLGVGQYAPERLAQRSAKEVHVHEVDEEHDHEHGEHDHDHSLVYSTWSWTSEKPLALSALRAMIDQLPITIYRAKGVLYLADMPQYMAVFQMVGRRAGLVLAGEWDETKPRSQVVMISSHGGLDSDKLTGMFESCLADQGSSASEVPAKTEWTRPQSS